jgi:hypothetical protein
MKYVNRFGRCYYVFQGTTKTGKPKYFVSCKPESESGIPIDALPDDFELFETPVDARVSIRRRAPVEISDNELQFVKEQVDLAVSNKATLVIRDKRCIVVYEAEVYKSSSSLGAIFGDQIPEFLRAPKHSGYMSPAFRFKLVSKKYRIFEAQRYCFRGSIDDWISLHREGTLDELCAYYLKHLGKESFYELM